MPTSLPHPTPVIATAQADRALSSVPALSPVTRIDSRDLFQNGRVVEIAHAGRLYSLRLTQLNKLILTA
ncbi:MAG: hemin uptake protein HemP [Pseudomonadota bacterium]